MPKSNKRAERVKIDNSKDQGLGWLLVLGQVIGVLAVLILGTFMVGGQTAQAWLLSLPLFFGLFLLTALNGWWRGKKGGMEIRTPGLWFLPFGAWVTAEALFNGSASWQAWHLWWIWVCAGFFFWMVLHFRENRMIHQWLGFGVLALVILVILASYNQALRSPQSMPLYRDLLQLQLPDSAIRNAYPGQPTGAFADPYQLGTFLVLSFFGLLVPALRSPFSVIFRLFLGYLALMCLPLIFWTGSPGAWLALVTGLILLPWIVYDTWRSRIWAAVVVIASIMIGGGLVYGLGLRGKAGASLASLFNEEVLRIPMLWKSALQAGMEHWLVGNGLGQFPFYFERFRPEGMTVDPLHVSNFYLSLWLDTGLVGLIAFFFPLGYAVYLLLKSYLRTPWMRSSGGGRHKRPLVSKSKLLSATFLLLTWVLFVDQWGSDLSGAPVLMLFVAVGLGFALRSAPLKEWRFSGNSLQGKAVPALFLVMGFLLPFAQYGRLWGMVQAEEGRRRLNAFSGDFHKVQEKRYLLEMTIDILQQSVEEYPENGSAWSDLSSATAHQRYLTPENRIEIAKQSEEQAREAIRLLPADPWAWIHLGNALWLQDRMGEADQAYRQAIEVAPNLSRAWFHYASFLRTQPRRQEEAMAAVERALALDPSDSDAVALKRRLLIP